MSLLSLSLHSPAFAEESFIDRIFASSEPSKNDSGRVETNEDQINHDYLADFCEQQLLSLPGPYDRSKLKSVCAKVNAYDECRSVNGDPIFHYERQGEKSARNKRIFALSLIHGDEMASGSVSRAWITRLENIDPRNTWRVIPIANPDAYKMRSRMNANKVDVNRNFPSADWDEKALKHWRTKQSSRARRYPGPRPASEPETRCLMKHLAEYKPDFVISIHTPLGVLDFDGPKVKNPRFAPLPWVSLGNFPGSLGRYMWVDRKVPVLTIELKGSSGLKQLEEFDRLQDITGTVAIQANRILKRKKERAKNDVRKPANKSNKRKK